MGQREYVFMQEDEKRLFHFADRTFNKYQMLPHASRAFEAMGKTFRGRTPTKDEYKEFGDTYGISAKKFVNIHNAIMTKQWIDPVRSLSKRLAFRGGSRKPVPELLSKVHEYKGILTQAEEDGAHNIIPILFLLGCNPKEAKKNLGKSLWKQLCKNSFTRNNHIAKLLWGRQYDYGQDYHNTLLSLNKIPSTVLSRGRSGLLGRFTLQGLSWALQYNETPLYKLHASDLSYKVDTIEDTRRMASQLGVAFKEEWNLCKMEQKHKEYTNKVMLRKYSPEPFSCLDNVNTTELNYKGYTATLLNNAKDIRVEGDVMKHCVGSYSDNCRDGRYLVYSITRDGKKSSTLGISRSEGLKQYKFSQHYKHCNGRVECEDEKELSTVLINQLNKQEKSV